MNDVVKTEPVTEEPKVAEVVIEAKPQPGEKTDSALLLKSLQEERDKRRDAEAEVERLKGASIDAPISDEGKFLYSRVQTLEQKLAAEDEQRRIDALRSTYPALKDKSDEFESFRTAPENAGMRIETAAKAFLADNDLLVQPKPRKGLESDTGGGRSAPKQGMTADEVEDLRVNNFREYSKRIRNGTLNT